MIKKILGILGVAVVGILVVAYFQPKDFTVTRSQLITATPSPIYSQVNNLRLWQAWSPWANLDPEMKETYAGPDAGEGAHFAWEGNKDVGAGSMTIAESRPNERIHIDLEWLKPFKATSQAEFKFEPQGNQTLVTWTMHSKNNLMARTMHLFMDCDKMLGDQFEEGLTKLKAVVEG